MKTKYVIRDLLPSEKSSFSWPACEAEPSQPGSCTLALDYSETIPGLRGKEFLYEALLALKQHKVHILAIVGHPGGQDTMCFVSCHGWKWEPRIGG